MEEVSNVTAVPEPILSNEPSEVAVECELDNTPRSNLEVYSFCVPLVGLRNNESEVSRTEEMGKDMDLGERTEVSGAIHGSSTSFTTSSNKCVVGTITVMKRSSAFVWVGWGDCEPQVSQPPSHSSAARSVSTLPMMGPLVISMPRTKYIGSISTDSSSSYTNGDPACSQLIGGETVDDQMIGWQMASRISLKLGWPILVACSLATTAVSSDIVSSARGDAADALEEHTEASLKSHRAAAVAEKEICRILTLLKNSNV